jgi:hypothetical protein
VIVEIVEIVAVVEGEAIPGGEVVGSETSIEGMAEGSNEGVHGTPDPHADAIQEIEAHSGELQGNQILTYPVGEEDPDETTVPELPHLNLDRLLLSVQTLAHHRVAVNALPRDHALRLLGGDLEHQRDEDITIAAVGVGGEEEVQTVNPAEGRPLPQEPRARALQGRQNEELPLILSAHLLRPDLDELVAILVPFLDHHLDLLAERHVEECLAAERGLAQLPRQTPRRMPWICVLGVVNAG